LSLLLEGAIPVSSSTLPRIFGRRSSSNVQKVLWLLAELGQACEQIDLGGSFGGNNAPDYLALNPNGRVPTLVDQDFVVWESNAICRYLACLHDDGRLYPQAPRERALCEQWMDWQLSTLQPAMVPLFVALVRTPEQQRDQRRLVALRDEAAGRFKLLEDALSGGAYLLGEGLTLADIANGIWTHRWFQLGLEQTPSPNLRRWYSRLGLRPAYKANVVDIPIA
jgi:glutathione S-transferase